MSYGDYVEQLTFLLFLKMADEQSRPPFNKPSPIPKGKDWPALLATHCSAFAASEAEKLGIYLLHPPEHSATLLANAQQEWLFGAGTNQGWFLVQSPLEAQ